MQVNKFRTGLRPLTAVVELVEKATPRDTISGLTQFADGKKNQTVRESVMQQLTKGAGTEKEFKR